MAENSLCSVIFQYSYITKTAIRNDSDSRHFSDEADGFTDRAGFWRPTESPASLTDYQTRGPMQKDFKPLAVLQFPSTVIVS